MNSRQKRTPLLGIVTLVVPVLAAPAWGQGLSHLWSQGFGGGFLDIGLGIAVDGDGNVLVTGQFRDTVDFGGGPITSLGGDDIFVAKFDAGGTHVWSHGFGSFTRDKGLGVSVDADGNVLVTGSFASHHGIGTIDFGGGPIVSSGKSDLFVAKFDPDGNHLWSHGFGGPTSSSLSSTPVELTSGARVLAVLKISGSP